MLVYLIGPSGAGKSTIAKGVVEQRSNISHIDLDERIKEKNPELFHFPVGRWEWFWRVAKECIEEIRRSDGPRITLIDCGAGCLQTEAALEFFRLEQRVIAFVGSLDVLFGQARISKDWQDRTLYEYEEVEFSSLRRRFYDSAKYKLEVNGVSERETIDRLISILADIK